MLYVPGLRIDTGSAFTNVLHIHQPKRQTPLYKWANSDMEPSFSGNLILVIIVLWYFAPTLFALAYGKKNYPTIFLINLVFGWTFIGWFAAMLFANMPEKEILWQRLAHCAHITSQTLKMAQIKLRANALQRSSSTPPIIYQQRIASYIGTMNVIRPVST